MKLTLCLGVLAATTSSYATESNKPADEHEPRVQIGNMIDATIVPVARCVDCHQFERTFSHPTNISPSFSMDVPPNLPLTNGKITCTTCHPSVGLDHTQRSAGSNTLSLRDETGIALCVQCHDPAGSTIEDLHALSLRRAHLVESQGAGSSRSVSVGQQLEWIDEESNLCMGCHDGAMASATGTLSPNIGRQNLLNRKDSDHPIGRYQLSDPSNADGPLRPSSMLDDRIRLFNNHVGCGSCHSLYSSKENLVVISNERSELCLSCHEY